MESTLERFRVDEGLGLVEVVVTMFLLALVAMSFLPFLLNGYVAARDNAARGTANSLVADALSRLRSDLDVIDRDCDWVEDWVAVNRQEVEVDGGTDILVSGAVECPTSVPGAATVTFYAHDQNDELLASAATKAYVAE